MAVESVEYLGRLVSKDGFRVYVYGLEAQKKLVTSWEQYQAHLETGNWHSSIDEIPKKETPVEAKPRKKGRG